MTDHGDMREREILTASGREVSRPLGTFSWTDLGTADWVSGLTAWDWLVDILVICWLYVRSGEFVKSGG